MVQKLLLGSEFEIVQFCQSGEDALEAYGRIAPDLVLMDIIMQGMDGMDASRKILHQWPDAKIVVISSMVYEDVKDLVKAIGGLGVVQKPLLQKELLDAMRNAMAG
jgi:two-component system chemotaxis response regulator CheY